VPYIEGLEYFNVPETQYIIDAFCPEKRLVMLLGREGQGKSKLAFAMAHAVVTGTQFCGMDVQQGHVLWYNLDNVFPDDMKTIASDLGHGDPNWAGGITWFEGPLKIRENEGDDIIELAKQKNSKLIIIDTLSALFTYEEIDEMYAFQVNPIMLDLIKIARNTNSCVVVLHHMPKDSENISGRGSTAIAGKADIEIYLTPDSSIRDTIHIAIKKSRTHRVQIFPIEVTERGYSLTNQQATGEPEGAWKGLLLHTEVPTQLYNDMQTFTDIFLHAGFRASENQMMAEHNSIMNFFQISDERIDAVIEHLLEEGRLVKSNAANALYKLTFDDSNEIDETQRKQKKMKKRLNKR